ncbi:MAG: SDR family oxidoreductase [Planctomycetota bacterium]|nr:MAG: SDR family oxidoreductase [Planctomycetota bacterium]GDY08302.1 beta-ketoacyl-ACP reductase [Planctomycetia bacterium]
MLTNEFSGKTVLVTGGSRGIGRAAALRLGSDGARVGVNYVTRRDKADEVVREIAAAGGSAVAVQGDVTSAEDVQRMVAETRAAFGPIGMLVHSAGLSILEKAEDVTFETWRRVMSVNLDGTFHVVYALKEEMIARKFGRIVLLSSIAALRERKNQVHYSAAKAGVIAMARCLAEAWAEHNIRINTICPGLIETEMGQLITGAAKKYVIDNTPMHRLGAPEEIAASIRFLLSDESSFITGQSLVVSGGRVMLPG